jgi:hypothetical protein
MPEKGVADFLKEVSVKIESLKEAKRLYGSQIAPDFYIFDYLRDDEMGLSRCIGNLLNPGGKHGQGDVFLKQLLIQTNQLLQAKMLNIRQDETYSGIIDKKQIFQWDAAHAEGCNIKLEQCIDHQRRIDVFLAFTHGELIGIENKPWAEDQKNQLLDYAAFMKKQAGGKPWLLIYLCNSDPSETSIPKLARLELERQGHFISMRYDELIDWLHICTSHAKAPVVRTFIEELIKFIRKDINGEVDMSVANEVKNIILQEGNFEAAINVSSAIDDAKKELIAKLKDDLTNATLKKGYKLAWKESMNSKWPTYSGFGFNFCSQQSFAFELWFEFRNPDLNGFYWGIRRRENTVINTGEHWQNINNTMSARFGSGKQSPWWPWWVDYELGANLKNWESNVAPWNAIKDGTLVKQIMGTANDVHQYFIDSRKLDWLESAQ